MSPKPDALAINFTDPPGKVRKIIEDHDAFDDDDCSIYYPGEDDDYMWMLEEDMEERGERK